MKFAILGLGNMGMALAKHALRDGFDVVAWNRTAEKTKELVDWYEGAPQQVRSSHLAKSVRDDTPAQKSLADVSKDKGKLIPAHSLKEVVEKLKHPRIVWNMVSAGSPTEAVLMGNEGLINLLDKRDIVIDGVNSHFRDSIRRASEFAKKDIAFLDCGTSGGVEGALNGACLMVGGDKKVYDHVEPIFKALATDKGYGYFGKVGAGHFVKMVHNSVEYGMMQSIGEGFELLKASDFDIDLKTASQVYSHGSIIESNLMKWLHQALSGDKNLADTDAVVGSLGTGKWAVEEALNLDVPYTANTHAVYNRYRSRHKESFQAKVVQALRVIFGAHTSKERDAGKLS